MINARSFVIPILGALLSATPAVYAQDVKLSEPEVSLQRLAVIQELGLPRPHFLSLPFQVDPSVAVTSAQDLSRYRGFQLGMNLFAAAKQADMNVSEARVIHQRPAVIQELKWRPPGSLGSSPRVDPIEEVLLSFCNGELFRMVVNYRRDRTEGLTDEDMVEAISAKYGTASRPSAKIILFSSFQVYDDSEKVIARWEDSQSSLNLFRSSYQPNFGMLVFSKRLDALAQTAIAKAIQLDEQGAPQREIDRQKKEDEENRATQETARLVNKAAFRP